MNLDLEHLVHVQETHECDGVGSQKQLACTTPSPICCALLSSLHVSLADSLSWSSSLVGGYSGTCHT
jgi:hypothetical protein